MICASIARRHALPAMRRRRPHRLDLAVRGVELLERAAPGERPVRPGGPERDVSAPQPVEIERVHALGRRDAPHVGEVLVEQRADLGAGQVVASNQHGRWNKPPSRGVDGGGVNPQECPRGGAGPGRGHECGVAKQPSAEPTGASDEHEDAEDSGGGGRRGVAGELRDVRPPGPAGMTFFVTSAGRARAPTSAASPAPTGTARRWPRPPARAAAPGARTSARRRPRSTAPNFVNARDRIGAGPWRNAKGVVVAQQRRRPALADEQPEQGDRARREGPWSTAAPSSRTTTTS